MKQELPREKHWVEGNLSVPYPASCRDFDPILKEEVPPQLYMCSDFVSAQMENTPFGKRGCNAFAWITGVLKRPNYNIIRLFMLRLSQQSLIPKDKAR